MKFQESTSTKRREIFRVRLYCAQKKQVLSGKVLEPKKKSRTDKIIGKRLYWWETKCIITASGKAATSVAAGENWLQSLLIAVDLIRRRIPTGQEHLWVTSDGVPSWLALPRLIPSSWGYEEYSLVRDYIERLEQRHEK